MARYYEFLFRNYDRGTRDVTVAAQRNTRSAAESAARGKLRKRLDLANTHDWFVVSVEPITEWRRKIQGRGELAEKIVRAIEVSRWR